MVVTFIIAGVISTAGGLAHAFLGDRFTVAPLDEKAIGSQQFTGDQNKRFLRWFWHIGSVVLLSTGAILLLHGTGAFAFQVHLLWYVSFLWVSTTTVFVILALKPPVQLTKMIPGLVGIPVNALILGGLL